MTGWPELRLLIERRDTLGVAAALFGLGNGQRKELEKPLRDYERQLRADLEPSSWARQPALAVAGAGILPNATAIAPWLARNRLAEHMWRQDRRSATITIVRDVLVARNVPWLGDLARRLADRLPAGWWEPDLWTLVSELVELTGIDPPDSDAFVVGWVEHHGGDRVSVARDLARDPRYAAFIPRLFEIERVTGSFWDGSLWPRAL